jgi:hypothetical protein
MKNILLLSTLIFSSSALARVADRKFECASIDGTKLKFELNFEDWQAASGYKRTYVKYSDGRIVPANFNSLDSTANTVKFDGLVFAFANSISGFETSWGFQIKKDSKEISKGACTDKLNKIDFWPYEDSNWQLVKLTCENGKQLNLPSNPMLMSVKLSDSYIASGPIGTWMDYSFMPVHFGKIYLSYSNASRTCWYNRNFTFSTYNPGLSTTPYWAVRYSETNNPFHLSVGAGGGAGSCESPSKDSVGENIRSGPFAADRDSVIFKYSSAKVCAAPTSRYGYGNVFATFHRQK